jgi:hypothetical protein
MTLLRKTNHGEGYSLSFDTEAEATAVSAFFKGQLSVSPALERLRGMEENEAAIVKIMHGALGVIDMGGPREYVITSMSSFGPPPTDEEMVSIGCKKMPTVV